MLFIYTKYHLHTSWQQNSKFKFIYNMIDCLLNIVELFKNSEVQIMVSYVNLKCEVSRWKVWNWNVKFERYKNLEGNGVLYKPQVWTLF